VTQLEIDAKSYLEQADLKSALQKWRQALAFLPAESERAAALKKSIAEHSETLSSPSWGGLGLIGAVLWKGKSLVLGLSNAGTLFSMLFAMLLYGQSFGWRFGVGIILLIYVHEMGHVFELSRLGFQFEAPRFVPGFGAYVLLKEKWTDPVEDAQIGLAGPRWGLVATLVCLGLFHWTRIPVLAALTKTSAWLNLFNLAPFWTLDGARAARALSRSQLMGIAALSFVLFSSNHDGCLLFILVFSLIQTTKKRERSQGHEATFWEFILQLSSLWYISSPGLSSGP
jgi:Zn-dependent protease